VAVNADGVVHELSATKAERVAFSDLVEISILTTANGPFREDLFWVLRGRDGSACVVPSSLAGGLLERLQRLPRFDNELVTRAAGSTTGARFLCWKGEPGEARGDVLKGHPAEQIIDKLMTLPVEDPG
jgi:hypothetical protein